MSRAARTPKAFLEHITPRTPGAVQAAALAPAPRFFMDSLSPNCFLSGRSASMDLTPPSWHLGSRSISMGHTSSCSPLEAFHTPAQDYSSTADHFSPSFQVPAHSAFGSAFPGLSSFGLSPAVCSEELAPSLPPTACHEEPAVASLSKCSTPAAVPLKRRVLLGRTREGQPPENHSVRQESQTAPQVQQLPLEGAPCDESSRPRAMAAHKTISERLFRMQRRQARNPPEGLV